MKAQKKSEEAQLYIAVENPAEANRLRYGIWVLEGRSKRLVAKRNGFRPGFCVHKGTLYDHDGYHIFKTIEDKDGANPLYSIGPGTFGIPGIDALASHGDHIYASIGEWEDCGSSSECETKIVKFSGDLVKLEEIPRSLHWTRAICSHNGRLYESRNKKVFICNGMEDIFVLERASSEIVALCSHEGRLFDATHEEVYNSLEDVEGKKPISKRTVKPVELTGLCSHNGRLYDADSYGKIFDTFKDELVYDFGEPVRAIISHRRAK